MFRLAIMMLCVAAMSGCGGGGGGGGSTAGPGLQSLVSRYYEGDPFTIVLLPDTQMYSHLYPATFTKQTQWIKDNVEELDIAFVLHVGDVVNIPGPTNGQWENAARSMNILDGVVPYAVVPGNHDYDDEGVTRATTKFNQFFPIEKFRYGATFGGAFEADKMDNTYHLFNAGNTNWLILCLEFGPRNGVLQWADELMKKYPNRRVIILTHSYLEYDNSLGGAKQEQASQPSKMGIGSQPGGANDGLYVWSKFASRHRNIQFVFCGHTPGDGAGRLISFGANGNAVYQVVSNYQYRENGGEGYLRIMKFEPNKGYVTVKTYSPLLDQYLTDNDNEFILPGVAYGAP